MKNNKDWLDDLRDRMADYEEAAPDGLWEEISSAISEQGTVRKAAMVPWLWRTALAVAAAAASVFLLLRHQNHTSQTNYHNEESGLVAQNEAPSQEVETPVENVISELVGKEPDFIRQNGQARRGRPVAQAVMEKDEILGRDVQASYDLQSLTKDEAGTVADDAAVPVPSKKDETLPESVTAHDGENWEGRMQVGESSHKRFAFAPKSVNFEFSGAATRSEGLSSFNPSHFYRGEAPNPSLDKGNEGDASSNDEPLMIPLPTIGNVNTITEHYRPIRIGAKVRWPIGSRAGVETGLVLTLLDSKFTTATGITSVEERQKLRFLGLPLDLSMNFYDSPLFSVYAVGGGMVEKCVSGRIETLVYTSDRLIGDPAVDKLSIDPFIFSLNGAAGLQFNLINKLGIYIEPGLSYHFKSESIANTIYYEHPFDFMLTFGARLSF